MSLPGQWTTVLSKEATLKLCYLAPARQGREITQPGPHNGEGIRERHCECDTISRRGSLFRDEMLPARSHLLFIDIDVIITKAARAPAQCCGKSPFWSIKPTIRDGESHCISAPSFLLVFLPLPSCDLSPIRDSLHLPLTDSLTD